MKNFPSAIGRRLSLEGEVLEGSQWEMLLLKCCCSQVKSECKELERNPVGNCTAGIYLGWQQRRLSSVLVHGMAHDVVCIAWKSLHGWAVQLRGVLGLHQGLDWAVHVGWAVWHVQSQGVVAWRGASLRCFAQSRSTIRKPNLRRWVSMSLMIYRMKTKMTHLDPGFTELCSLAKFLPCVNVRILRSFKGLLKFIQLIRCECGAGTPLFSLQRDSRFSFHVRAFFRPFWFNWNRKDLL